MHGTVKIVWVLNGVSTLGGFPWSPAIRGRADVIISGSACVIAAPARRWQTAACCPAQWMTALQHMRRETLSSIYPRLSREYIVLPCTVMFKTCLQWINRWRWWSLRNRYCEKSWNRHISHIINYFWNWLWIINILIGVGGIRKYPGHDSWRFVTASLSRGTSRQVTWHVTGVTTDSDTRDSS